MFLPFIGELTPVKWWHIDHEKDNAENQPTEFEVQKAWHTSHGKRQDIVDYAMVTSDGEDLPLESMRPDMENALDHIAKNVLPGLCTKKPSGHIQLLIASHGFWLSEELKLPSRCENPGRFDHRSNILNGMTIQIEYEYDDISKTLTQANRKCEVLHPGTAPPAQVSKKDVARCSKGFTKFIKTTDT